MNTPYASASVSVASARRSSRIQEITPEQGPTGQHPDQAATDEGQAEFAQTRADVRLASAHDHAEQDGEQHDRRRIVEKRLAFGQADQARRRADIAKDGDHRGGIGGGDDGAQQQAGDERHARERPQGEADHRRRHQGGDDGEQQDGRCILDHAPHVGGEAGLEHQERQEHVDVGRRADRQVDEDVGEDVGRGRTSRNGTRRPAVLPTRFPPRPGGRVAAASGARRAAGRSRR